MKERVEVQLSETEPTQSYEPPSWRVRLGEDVRRMLFEAYLYEIRSASSDSIIADYRRGRYEATRHVMEILGLRKEFDARIEKEKEAANVEGN